jgi:glutathione S-transferase
MGDAMGYRLYGRIQSGSMAIEAALALSGADWTLIDTPRPKTDAGRAALLGLNPRGQVPILVHPDGTVITEGPAILSHLADAFPAAHLAPTPGSAHRARHDRWMAFFQANVYEGMLRELAPARYTEEATGGPAIAASATGYVRRHFLIFEAEISQSRPAFFFADQLAMLDIYLWMLCFWLDRDWLAASCPAVDERWSRLRPHPVLGPIETAHFG